MTANYADSEWQSDWLANRPDTDRPDIRDVIDTTPVTSRPGVDCGFIWGRWHDARAEADAHGCWGPR